MGVTVEQFEVHRRHLNGVAYRMLGSLAEADDAVQECWLRLDRADTSDVRNMRSWLTTVTARICLDMLRTRRARAEEPLDVAVPDPVVTQAEPESEAVLADSVGFALMVVLETLTPAERLAFVLHDMFAVPYDEIGKIVGRSTATARQLASRARRRVRSAGAVAEADPVQQRRVVNAFLAAARHGDFDALIGLLDPEVRLRGDIGPVRLIRGAAGVARQALAFSGRAELARPALVNGALGLVVAAAGKPIAVMSFTVAAGRIVELDILADPARLRRLDRAAFGLVRSDD